MSFSAPEFDNQPTRERTTLDLIALAAANQAAEEQHRADLLAEATGLLQNPPYPHWETTRVYVTMEEALKPKSYLYETVEVNYVLGSPFSITRDGRLVDGGYNGRYFTTVTLDSLSDRELQSMVWSIQNPPSCDSL